MGAKSRSKMEHRGGKSKDDGNGVKKKARKKERRPQSSMNELMGTKGAVVFEKTSDLVSITTFSLTPTYVFVNPSHKTVLGYETHDLIGQCALDFIHPDDKKKLLPLLGHYVNEKSKGVLPKREQGITEKIHYRLADSRGNWRHLETTGDLLDEDYILFVSRDITQERETEEALRRSEESYRLVVEDMPALICRFLPDGSLIFVNSRYASFFSKTKEALIGQNFFQFIPEEQRQKVRHHVSSLSQEKPMVTYEHQVIAPDGSLRWQQWTDRAIFDEEGRIREYQSLGIDITDQRQAEEALKISEKKYRNLVENMNDLIYTVDRDGKVTFVSPSVESLIQYGASEVMGRHLGEFIHQGDLPLLAENFQRVLSGHGAANEYRILTKTGDVRWIRTSSQPVYAGDRVIGAQGVVSDITERKEAEEKLRHSEERYRSLLEHAPIGIYYNDFQGKFIYGNKKAEDIIGYKSEELLGKSFLKLELVSAEDLRKAAQLLSRNQQGEATGPDELVLKRKDGPRVIVEVTTEVINVEGEDVALGMVQDITKRKQAEEGLRSSEEKYRLLVENANDAIFIVQEDQIKFPNKKARDMGAHLGLELDRLPFFNYIHSSDRGKVADRLRRRLAGENVPHTYDFRLVGREGQEMWVQLNAVLISWEGRPASLNFLRDITAQKSLESQLQQVRRMEALGTLAGGIAHDFNNLLMGIQGRTSLMLMDVSPEQPQYEELKHIEDIVKSGADLTKQLLGFARGGKYELKATNLNSLIQRTSEMFSRTRKQIRIYTELAEDLWVVEIDRAQIEQVLLNLYVNAWQAMPEGGDLCVQTNNAVLDEEAFEPHQVKPGKHVRVSVIDSGVGMDEATLQRIFDPFFTTHEIGRGTGLGLASAYGIIKNHGGIIQARSKEGEGSAFHIYLPASEKEILEERVLPGQLQRGNETVLLVDDERDVLRITERLLDSIGYHVLAASSGEEAVQIYEKNHDNIDIVILDMIMPGMSGGEVFDRLKEINGHVRVLLSSGYSIDGEASKILDRGCHGFIQKPFRINLLAQKMREVLNKA
jgi:PAS domain S-box-containing protein